MAPKTTSQWYAATCTYKSVHVGRPRKRHLWERTIFLVSAPDEQSAGLRAEEIARRKEHEYISATGDLVRWTYREIESVKVIFDDTLSEGTEVWYEFFEKVDRAALSESE